MESIIKTELQQEKFHRSTALPAGPKASFQQGRNRKLDRTFAATAKCIIRPRDRLVSVMRARISRDRSSAAVFVIGLLRGFFHFPAF